MDAEYICQVWFIYCKLFVIMSLITTYLRIEVECSIYVALIIEGNPARKMVRDSLYRSQVEGLDECAFPPQAK